jgi:Cys-tRNA(Pro)/Cys-tRNA(Cys) deacylase
VGAQGTRAIDALKRAGIAHAVVAYGPPGTAGRAREHRPAYGAAAAAALGIPPDRICKTLVASVDGELVLAVVPVACQLDLKRLAAALGGRRAELADPMAAERATGYVVGGISPLGTRRRLRTVLDTSVTSLDQVHVSAGRRGLQVALTPDDLVRATGAVVAPIGTPDTPDRQAPPIGTPDTPVR